MSAQHIIKDADDLSPLATYWLGDWLLSREIVGCDATMNGTAHFESTRQINCLDYCEQGTLMMSKTGDSFNATRCYTFECADNGVTVYFADGKDKGKVFQNLRPENLTCEQPRLIGTHHCINDIYKTTYQIVDPNRFIAIHRVEGPAKNYVSTTYYTRSPSNKQDYHA